MGFFDRFRSPQGGPARAGHTKPSPVKASKPASDDAAPLAVTPVGGSHEANRLLLKPHVSEKAARLADRGTYVFDVPVSAEKVAIRKAIESLYKVKVAQVRTIHGAGKPVFRGRRASARKDWKKALVTLQAGQKIEIYEGV